VGDLSRLKLSDVIFWILAGMSAVALVVLLLVVAGVIPIDDASEPESSPTGLEQPQAPTPPTTQAAERVTSSGTTVLRAVEPAEAVVVLTAVRGESWFSARVGSENGRVLDERVLALGETVRLRGERIWLSVGAAGNVDVTVDGKPKELAPGTVSVVLTPRV
jgi:hypothetical protein